MIVLASDPSIFIPEGGGKKEADERVERSLYRGRLDAVPPEVSGKPGNGDTPQGALKPVPPEPRPLVRSSSWRSWRHPGPENALAAR